MSKLNKYLEIINEQQKNEHETIKHNWKVIMDINSGQGTREVSIWEKEDDRFKIQKIFTFAWNQYKSCFSKYENLVAKLIKNKNLNEEI